MLDRPQKITFAEMRESGVRGLLIYCADYRCSTSLATFDLSNATYRPFADGLGFVGETMMKHAFLALATLLAASGDNSAFAQSYYCPGGQRPVPPAVAARMALPLCGFDAAKRWTGNMCQLSTRGICIRTRSSRTQWREAAITRFDDHPNLSITWPTASAVSTTSIPSSRE